MPTTRRSWLTDVAGLGLAAWAVLLAYVSIPTLAGPDPLWDAGISVLGALLALLHLAAAFGVLRRAGWGRRLALAVGAIGLFGSGMVLVTLAASVLGRHVPGATGFVGVPLAVPAGMVTVYALIVAILARARSKFSLG